MTILFLLLLRRPAHRSNLPSSSLRWATNLGGTGTANGRDSAGKRLGIKRGNGSTVQKNEILVRQRGYNYYPGENVHVGRDFTLHAAIPGKVVFSRDEIGKRTVVNVKAPPGPPPRSFLLDDISEAYYRLNQSN